MSQLGIEHHRRAMSRLAELSQWYNEVVDQMHEFNLMPTLEQYDQLVGLLPRFKRSTLELKKFPALKPELQTAFAHFITRCEQSLSDGKTKLISHFDPPVYQQQSALSLDVNAEEFADTTEATPSNQIKKELKQIATQCGCNWEDRGNSLTITRQQEKLAVIPKENGMRLQGSNSLGIEILEQWCQNHGWNKRDLKLKIILPSNIKPDSLEGMAALATFKEYTRNGFLVQDFPLTLFRHATKMSDKEFHELNWNYLTLQDESAALQYN